MKQILLPEAVKLNNERKRRKIWRKIVQGMAAVVVFCTTYALILPAITMEKEIACGMEAHIHEESCYECQGDPVLECAFSGDESVTVLHSHSEICYGPEGDLRCTLAERPSHTHGDSCYGEAPLHCELVEAELHIHGENCAAERLLICTLAEDEGHIHDESCSTQISVLRCELAEGQGHTHDDTCLEAEWIRICELEETEGHIHSEECVGTESVLICEQEVSAEHSHGEECFTVLDIFCDLPEVQPHSHGEACFELTERNCELAETIGHVHGEDCYELQQIPCEQEERAPHVHADECYAESAELCEIPESEGHLHQPECYDEKPLICPLEEIQPHQHDENCVDAEGAVICEQEEILEHVHDDSCLRHPEVQICELTEHTHVDACYVVELEPENTGFLCGFGEHSHSNSCVITEGESACSIPEHIHTAACVVEALDMTADVENREIWNAMFRDITLTGNWPGDLLAIAQSQVGYQESRQNCILEDQQIKGYTRYGDCYGDPYGSWSALFVRFCMEYADISYYPMMETETAWADPAQWAEQLRKDGHYRNPQEYTPQAGDLIFLAMENTDGSVDHMGIVTYVIPAAETESAKIQVIAGDVQNSVCSSIYETDDVRIQGYSNTPSGYATTMQYTGADYSVVASFSPDAKIPAWAEMSVREVLPDTEEYAHYYRQSVESLMEQSGADCEEALGLTFARFFDIGFLVNEKHVEPAAPVAVQIQYGEPIAVTEDQTGKAVHFAEDGVEILDAALSGVSMLPEDAVETQQIDTFSFTQDSFSVVGTVLTNTRAATVTVWLDGTCGGLMAYEGSDNVRQQLVDGKLPSTWKSPTRYAYTLKGWYDVTHSKYYAAGAVVDSNVGTNTVFYADWVSENYSTSQPNSHTVTSMDTSDFITTYVFDYNALFNMQSVDLASYTSYDDYHSETWNLVENGNVDYNKVSTLDFIFRDHDGSGALSHPNLPDGSSVRNEPNTDQLQAITTGIYNANLGNLLFNPGSTVLGKQYLGTGNYLYQYMDDPSDPRYGYYYYDSFRNSASYNQNAGRFYVYDYLEYARDTIGNGLDGTNADFLPLNSPASYVNLNGQVVYASQRNQEPNEITNFFFGIRSDIHFYLPNDAGATDANGNYLNKSTTGDDMIFEFSGDDDVWVLLDGRLLLDVGGIHQVRGGRIDFSRGVVYTTKAGSNDYEARTFDEILGDNKVKEGPHDLTIYYLERGSSMSNCAIYFNLAPRYGLNLEKEDYITGENLPDVTFQVYNDEVCTIPAKLWTSHTAAKNNEASVHTFTTNSNGFAHMWGFVAGKTYYIKEIGVPAGYPVHNDLIRVSLNNHGTDISEVTVIRNSSNTEGFEVTYHAMGKEEHLISMVLTNKKTEDQLTEIRVEKQWGEGTAKEVPVQMYLLANGQATGSAVTLSVDNGWGHTWTNLPLKQSSGEPIQYTVEEVYLPGYQKESIEKTTLKEDKITWVKVGVMEDGARFLLALDSDTMLTANNGTFGSVSMQNAKGNANAQWETSAYLDGFRVHTGAYYLAFNNSSKQFYLTTNSQEGNQTFYYDGSQIFVMSGNVRYYVGDLHNGLSATTGGNATGLYKRLVTKQGTTLYRITNTSIPEEQQKGLRVEKYWEGNAPDRPDKITVYLKKGDQIVTTLELSEENNWQATVNGLDGTLLLNGGYTLEEEAPFGFSPEYGQVQDISVDQWNWNSGQEGLISGEVYAFVTNNRALADANGTITATAYNGTPTLNQQWQVVESSQSGGGTIQVLKNVGTGRYLREENQNLAMVEAANGQCKVRLLNGRLQYYPQNDGGGWSLNISDQGTVGVAWGSNAGTVFTIYEHESRSEYRITVTNVYGTYILPETGGTGTAPYYTFGGLLIMAAALMYLLKAVCRRQKGGS